MRVRDGSAKSYYLTFGAETYIVQGGVGALRAGATRFGAIAQLGERYNGIVEVKGSSPFSSTRADGGRLSGRHVMPEPGWQDLTGSGQV